MSQDWVNDIKQMHEKYGVNTAMEKLTPLHKYCFLEFRRRFLIEELNEILDGLQSKNADEVVDGFIDLIVVSMTTLDAFDIDMYKAWDEVLKANLNKTPGVKPGRPNPLGLPDLIKLPGWIPPTHNDNLGTLQTTLDAEYTYTELLDYIDNL